MVGVRAPVVVAPVSLQLLDRYDPSIASDRAGHAVVLGAGIAGLLAARVLSDHFERVTIIERDPLPDTPTARRGIPQAKQPHVLLESGRKTVEDLMPGFSKSLLEHGGLLLDWASDMTYYDEGGTLANGVERIPVYVASRPLVEFVIRRRLQRRENVTVMAGWQWTGYLFDDQNEQIIGVNLRDGRDEAGLKAELVVDATGRTSRSPALLDERGFDRPPVDEVTIGVKYSSIIVRRPADDRRMMFVPPSPPRTIGGGAFPLEDGRWLLTLQGVHGDEPPSHPEGFLPFADRLPLRQLREIVAEHECLSEAVVQHPFPSSLRRRYEEVDSLPAGWIAVGDAIASLNPVYAQGMSAAAMEALVLHQTLAEVDDDRLATPFFDRAARVIDNPWRLTAVADFAFSETSGDRPFGTTPFNWYLSRLIRVAHHDGRVANDLSRVMMLERQPRSLLRPRLLRKALFA
ncbi:MAG: NAD(P)/FAD-dependent oxidoreductase [Halobacteriota archaeon]